MSIQVHPLARRTRVEDFYEMAEHETHKGRYMYVLGTEHAVRFLSGGRSMSSVLSRNEALRKKFTEKFGDRYRKVRDYYLPRKESVVIQNVSPFVPGLVAAIDAAEAEEDEPVPLNGGILIVGSLLWDERRERWRRSLLSRLQLFSRKFLCNFMPLT